MPKMLDQARSMCPELKESIKELDSLAYQRQYDTVFRDLIDWLVWEHQYPPSEEHPLKKQKYNEEEIAKGNMIHLKTGAKVEVIGSEYLNKKTEVEPMTKIKLDNKIYYIFPNYLSSKPQNY